MGSSEPYKQKDWLYERYWRRGEDTGEMAERCGVTDPTIGYWMDKHGIPTRGGGLKTTDTFIFSMRPREWLFEEYWVKDKSSYQIATENGVSGSTVSDRLSNSTPPIKLKPNTYYSGHKNPNVKPPDRVIKRTGYASYRISLSGDTNRHVPEHRITAIAEWGLDSVKGKHVHHANGIKWLNVPEFDMDIPELENPNLVPIDPISHAQIT